MNMDTSIWLNNLLSYSLQVGLLIAVAGCLPWLLRVHTPHVLLRYYQLWLLICLLLPMLQPWERKILLPIPPLYLPVDSLPTETIPRETIPRVAVSMDHTTATILQGGMTGNLSLSVPGIVAALLGIGILLRLAWFLLGILRLVRYRRSSQPMKVDPSGVEEISQQLGVRAEIRVSEQIQGPVSCGLWRPLILFPQNFPLLSESHQRAIIYHEFLHVKRRDWLFILGEQLACALFWFHPGIWWLIDRIRLKREQAVDELAAGLMQDRRQYAQALLESAYQRICPSTVPAPFFLVKRHLKQRISLLFREVRMSKQRLLLSLVSMMSVAFLAGIMAVWAFPLFRSLEASSSPGESILRDGQHALSGNPTGKILQFRMAHFVEPSWLIPSQHAEVSPMLKAMNRPNKPFRMIGNIHYVGASDLTAYLIITPQGHILLDCGLEETAPMIKENITQLGFRLEDVKWILVSHGHLDHAGGVAQMKEATGALLLAGEIEKPLLERGGKGDFHYGDQVPYPPVKVDRTLRDQETVELGGVRLTAHLTPGHTKGCITWTMQVEESGRLLEVVFVGSTSIPGYRLIHNTNYPNIAEDYTRMFAVMKQLPGDIFFGAHGIFYSMQAKRKRLDAGEKPNPYIDPEGYKSFINATEQTYREQLKKEQEAKR